MSSSPSIQADAASSGTAVNPLEPAPADVPSAARGVARAMGASQYKPELFAQMSHELRTPLNSLLVLSKMLVDNPEKNLTAKQVTFAQAIHASGNELLSLISDILELAKIESNALAIEPAEVTLEHLREHLEQTFRYRARDNAVGFAIELQSPLPAAIITDSKRLQQILRNLLSHAFNFTERGSVSLSVSLARYGWSSDQAALDGADHVLAFSVSHTGLGLAKGELDGFVEVFGETADGAARRGLGATRLGLVVSRQIATLLGGELRVVGVPGSHGSVTLYLPASHAPEGVLPRNAALWSEPAASEPRTLPVSLDEGDRAAPSGTLGDLATAGARGRTMLMTQGSEVLHAAALRSAATRGYEVATTNDIMTELGALTKALPAAILLDLRTQDLEGWVVLDRLTQDLATRHIPVLVLLPRDHWPKARRMGAAGLLSDPGFAQVDVAMNELAFYALDRRRRVLVVHSSARQAEEDIIDLISIDGVDVKVALSVEAAALELGDERFHACVLCLGPSESKQLALCHTLPVGGERTPIIVYARRPWSAQEEQQVKQCASGLEATGLVLRSAPSRERLLHELSICLHLPERAFSSIQRRLLAEVAQHPPELAGARVLLIDADVRNVFAMTSALERHGALVSYADNVQAGLALLDDQPNIAALLIDAGLAAVDDYALVRHLRRARRTALPCIAMASQPSALEREQCLRVGVSHYIGRPIAAHRLISVLRLARAE